MEEDYACQAKVLREPFDLLTHKSTFRNYLEVVIARNGAIVYANPSHTDVLARMYAMMTGGDAIEDCPRSRYAEYDEWLMEQTGCVCVWNCGYTGRPNERQAEALGMLRREGLLRDEETRWRSGIRS